MNFKSLVLILLFIPFTFTHTSAQHKGKKFNKKLFQGSWFGTESDDAAVFYVDGDSITYIDEMLKFRYTINKDTFELKTSEPHYKMVIQKLTEDSLIFKEIPSMQIDRYWKQ